jgi:hypothetical protein
VRKSGAKAPHNAPKNGRKLHIQLRIALKSTTLPRVFTRFVHFSAGKAHFLVHAIARDFCTRRLKTQMPVPADGLFCGLDLCHSIRPQATKAAWQSRLAQTGKIPYSDKSHMAGQEV